MPFYDFKYAECDEVFEIRASIQEKEAGLKPDCPKCHSHKAQQVLTTGLVMQQGQTGRAQCDPNAGSGCCGG